MLKDKVEYTKSGLNEFVDHMLDFVKQQDNKMKRAVCQVTWRKMNMNGCKWMLQIDNLIFG